MKNIKSNLIWYKYRPKTLDLLIIPERIKSFAKSQMTEEGITENIIFFGPPGTGKSTLAEILIQDHSVMIMNASDESSVEVLRDKITLFAESMNPMASDLQQNRNKIILLEEFDGVSKQYKEALKAFIEQHQNIRILGTSNNPESFSEAIFSRFQFISFYPQDSEERDFLKSAQSKRVGGIAQKEGLQFQPQEIFDLVDSKFPDMRSMINALQLSKLSNSTISSQAVSEWKELENLCLNLGPYEKTVDWVLLQGLGKIPEILKYIGSNFPKSLLGTDLESLFPGIVILASKYQFQHNFNTLDPAINLSALIFEIQLLVKEKKHLEDGRSKRN